MIEYSMVLICKHCNKSFKNKHKNQIFCSSICMGLHKMDKRLDRVCVVCDRKFRAKTNLKVNKYCSKECYWVWMYGNTRGKNCVNWKGGKTTENKRERGRFRKYIQKKVFERDNYTCLICGIRGKNMTVDHIQSWAEYEDKRFDMDNCRTLCQECHYKITFHKQMPKTIKVWGHNLSKTMI